MARRRSLRPALQFFCFCFSRGRRSTVGTSTDMGTSLTVFPFSVFGTSRGRFWHVDGHCGQPYSFSVFCFSRGRRSNFGTSTDIGTSLTVFLFFCFWHVEGALLARRRTLGPALQFFCFKLCFWARRRGAFGTSTDIGTMPYSFSVFCFSKEHCWHVDGHWDQPDSFSVFLFLARRRGAFGTSTDTAASLTVFLFLFFPRSAFGTSTDIGTSLTVSRFSCFWHVEGALLARRRTLGPCLTVFLFFCFWHVEGALLARRRTLGPALQFFCFSVFLEVEGALLARRRTLGPALQFFCFSAFWHVEGALLARRRTLGLALKFF